MRAFVDAVDASPAGGTALDREVVAELVRDPRRRRGAARSPR